MNILKPVGTSYLFHIDISRNEVVRFDLAYHPNIIIIEYSTYDYAVIGIRDNSGTTKTVDGIVHYTTFDPRNNDVRTYLSNNDSTPSMVVEYAGIGSSPINAIGVVI